MSTVVAHNWIDTTPRPTDGHRRRGLKRIVDPIIERVGERMDYLALSLLDNLQLGQQPFPMVTVIYVDSWALYALLGLDRSQWIAELLYLYKNTLGHKYIYSVTVYRNQNEDLGYGLIWDLIDSHDPGSQEVLSGTRPPFVQQGKVEHPWESPQPGQAEFAAAPGTGYGVHQSSASGFQHGTHQGSGFGPPPVSMYGGQSGPASGVQPGPSYGSQPSASYPTHGGGPGSSWPGQPPPMPNFGAAQAAGPVGQGQPGLVDFANYAPMPDPSPPQPYGSPRMNPYHNVDAPAAAHYRTPAQARERQERLARAFDRYNKRFPGDPNARRDY